MIKRFRADACRVDKAVAVVKGQEYTIFFRPMSYKAMQALSRSKTDSDSANDAMIEILANSVCDESGQLEFATSDDIACLNIDYMNALVEAFNGLYVGKSTEPEGSSAE